MRRFPFALAVVTILLIGTAVTGTGCKKKVVPPPPAPIVQPPPPPAPPPPAPTITLSASPSTIEKGQSTTLSWKSSNAAGVTINGGVGTVEPSGNRTVRPSDSTTYTARATGPGGSATAEARVTVTTPPPVVPPPPPPPITDAMFFASNVNDCYFDYDKYNIRDDARAALQGDARALVERSGIKFTLEGHCDERGSEKYNLALGDRRANAAKEFLVGQGISSERIDTISYGKERPVCTEHNEECWQKNRRAHFVLR